MPTLTIRHDDAVQDTPRDWDNLGIMACWHHAYKLGDVQPKEDTEEWLKDLPKGSVVLPLYLFDHSGISMRTEEFSCQWDSGRVGYIYVNPEKIRAEMSVKYLTKKVRELVRGILRQEVKAYNWYLEGNIWGYTLENDVDEYDVTDSCWGFFGEELEDTGIADHISDEYQVLLRKAWDLRFDEKGVFAPGRAFKETAHG
jgi:hypothetical protein